MATDLEGKKIVKVRAMTAAEQRNLGWYGNCVVLELDDGTKLFPSQDEEGNGPGALFGRTDGTTFNIMATTKSTKRGKQ